MESLVQLASFSADESVCSNLRGEMATKVVEAATKFQQVYPKNAAESRHLISARNIGKLGGDIRDSTAGAAVSSHGGNSHPLIVFQSAVATACQIK